VSAAHRPLHLQFLVGDLAGNPIARTAPLAQALAPYHRVEVVGLLAPGTSVYAPYRDTLPVTVVRGDRRDPRSALRLARRVGADVIIACKPIPATLLAGLAARRGRTCALLLDVDDDEWTDHLVEPGPGLRRRLARLTDVQGRLARALHPLTRRVDAVTVASRALQRRYGGTLVRHGPDERIFDPERFTAAERAATRRTLGLPADRPVAVFAGVPRPHKGFDVLVEALCAPAAAEWSLVGVGERGAPWFERARARLGERFVATGAVDHAGIPALLHAADAAPVPQRDVPYAESQLPAKLLEAMAMRVPVVATPIGDIPEILGDGARGVLVPPGDAGALADGLARIAREPAEAAERARRGRAWFLTAASTASNGPLLQEIVAAALRHRTAGVGRWR
jgi:glycosyltransferase involved in cell wall biosynthesis